MILWDKPLLYSANEEKLPESQTGNGGPDKGLPATGDEWKQVPSGFKAQGKWYQKKDEGSKINYSDEKPSGKEGSDEEDESSVNPLLDSAREFIKNGGTPKGYQRVQGPYGQTLLWAIDEEGEPLDEQYHPEHEREYEEQTSLDEEEVEEADELEEEEEEEEEDFDLNIFAQDEEAQRLADEQEMSEYEAERAKMLKRWAIEGHEAAFGDLPNYDESDPDYELYEKWKNDFMPQANGRDIQQKAVGMVMALSSGKITKQEYDKINQKFFTDRFENERQDDPEEEEPEEEEIEEQEEVEEEIEPEDELEDDPQEDDKPMSFADIKKMLEDQKKNTDKKKKGKK